MPFSAVWSKSTLFAILCSLIRVYTVWNSQQSDQGLHCLPFSVWSVSTLFAFLGSLIRVYTVCYSQHSDQGPHYLPVSEVRPGSTLFDIFSSLIRVYTICHSQQSDHGLHHLPFSAIWSRNTLFAILSKQYYQGLHCLQFSAIWLVSTLFVILNSLTPTSDHGVTGSKPAGGEILPEPKRRFIAQSLSCSPFHRLEMTEILLKGRKTLTHPSIHQQSDQGLHRLPFSAVWSGSTLFAILSLIRVYTICHSQSDQGLHCSPFSAVWSGSTVFAILSCLIKVNVYTVILRNSPIRVYTICHSQQFDQGLYYFSILSK